MKTKKKKKRETLTEINAHANICMYVYIYNKKATSTDMRYYYSFNDSILIVQGRFMHLSIAFEFYGLNIKTHPIMNMYLCFYAH